MCVCVYVCMCVYVCVCVYDNIAAIFASEEFVSFLLGFYADFFNIFRWLYSKYILCEYFLNVFYSKYLLKMEIYLDLNTFFLLGLLIVSDIVSKDGLGGILLGLGFADWGYTDT